MYEFRDKDSYKVVNVEIKIGTQIVERQVHRQRWRQLESCYDGHVDGKKIGRKISTYEKYKIATKL